METENKRSATDILLDVESRLETVEKRIQNSENLLKILLGRMNAAMSGAPPQPKQPLPARPAVHNAEPNVINKDNFENRHKTSKFTEAAAQQGVVIEDPEPTQHLRETFTAKVANLPPDPSGNDLVEAPIRGNARGQRGPKSSGVKSSVSQVLSRGETPLFLANIEVLDQEGVLINQTRTNTKGRWLMALAPGDYQVHVLKRFPPDSGKLPIDTMFPINVPQSDKPMELDSLSLAEPTKQ